MKRQKTSRASSTSARSTSPEKSKTSETPEWTLIDIFEGKNTTPIKDTLGIFRCSLGGTIKIWTKPIRTYQYTCIAHCKSVMIHDVPPHCICHDPADAYVKIEFHDHSFLETVRCACCLKNMIGRKGGG